MRIRRKQWLLLSLCVIWLSVITGIIWIEKKKAERKAEGHMPYGPYEAVWKRLLDVVFAGTALLLLSPVMGVIALMVRRKLGSPVIFRQKRPGLNGEEFILYKFRTMTNEYGEDGKLLSDEERMTEFGKLLRSTSLDELPELINIIKGEMSIVGPRPLLMEYVPLYNAEQLCRHKVRPGLTGLAQVSGRNELSWEKRFEGDIRYVEKVTFLGDIRIICKTFVTVLGRRGIQGENSVTMEPFRGNGGMEEGEV